MLSNLLFVTLSLTLIAGNGSVPASCIWYRRCTPVVVSSLMPLIAVVDFWNQPGVSLIVLRIVSRMYLYSSGSLFSSNSGTLPAFSNSSPLIIRSEASPPSSTI